jgi:hypothetical protein
MPYKKIPNRNTNGFDKNPQNINRKGTPKRKLVSTVIAEMDEKGIKPATPTEIKTLYLSFLNLTRQELTDIAKDEAQPMLNRIISKAMLDSKGFDVIKEMLDRSIGKANQQIEATITNTEPITGFIIEVAQTNNAKKDTSVPNSD